VNDVAARLANRLRTLRASSGLTQAKLAERAGVRPETVARLERVVRERASANFNPSVDTLVRLATALGVDIADLFRQGASTGKVGDERRLAVLLARANDDMREKVLRVAELLILNDPGRTHPAREKMRAPGRRTATIEAPGAHRTTRRAKRRRS
jgi:transcriptional regulator with XRE-family HTH domain